MVAYSLRWTLLKYFSSIPDEQSQQKVRRLGRITHAVINTSNEVKCRLLWEFSIYNFSRRILERVFVGSIVNIRNECLFVWVHGEWIVARNKQIVREPLRGSRDLFVPRYGFIPHEPRKKDTHSFNDEVNLLFSKIKKSHALPQFWAFLGTVWDVTDWAVTFTVLPVRLSCLRWRFSQPNHTLRHMPLTLSLSLSCAICCGLNEMQPCMQTILNEVLYDILYSVLFMVNALIYWKMKNTSSKKHLKILWLSKNEGFLGRFCPH